MEVEIRGALEEANKRRQRRKSRLCQGESLTVEELQRPIAEASIEGQVAEEGRGGPGQVKQGKSRCSLCKMTGTILESVQAIASSLSSLPNNSILDCL